MTQRAAMSVGALLGILFLAPVLVLDALLLGWLINDSIRPEEIRLLSYLVGLFLLLSLPLLVVLAYQVMEGLSIGAGIPMRRSYSKVNFFADFSRRSLEGATFTYKEDYFTFGLSLNMYDMWFLKRKYD